MQLKKNKYKISKLKRAQNAVEEKQLQNLKIKKGSKCSWRKTNTKSQIKKGSNALVGNEYKISK